MVENLLTIEDAQEAKKQADFQRWLARWRWLAWSTKKNETRLPEFIEKQASTALEAHNAIS